MCQNLMAVFQLYLEHGVWKLLNYGSFNFRLRLLLTFSFPSLLPYAAADPPGNLFVLYAAAHDQLFSQSLIIFLKGLQMFDVLALWPVQRVLSAV